MDWLSDLDETAETFAATLIRWYQHHKRDLPWRHTRDPYRIWLSEVILQQTRVAQGLPYYERFVETFPTVHDLAAADERELLRLWQGLGYYSRARNLHRTAKIIATDFGGRFPATYHELLQLSGIGAYTAAAVASFAFDEKVAVVDGNVYRVLARLFSIEEDITTTSAKKTFSVVANRLIGATNPLTPVSPALFNQAIMEFGAIQCTPVAPDCLFCPFQQQCRAFLTGRQHQLPVKSKKAAVRDRFFQYVVIRQRHSDGDWRLAMRERTGKDVWQNLFDFFLIETEKNILTWDDLLQEPASKGLPESLVRTHSVEEKIQLLSHQRIRARFWQTDLPEEWNGPLPDGLKFYKLPETERLPKPILIADYLKKRVF